MSEGRHGDALNFSSVVQSIHRNLKPGKTGKPISQRAMIDLLFGGLLARSGKKLWDGGLINRWFNGNAEISPLLREYYVDGSEHVSHQEELAVDIQYDILPDVVEVDQLVQELSGLLGRDCSIPLKKKAELTRCLSRTGGALPPEAVFLASVLCFAMERPNHQPADRDRPGAPEALPLVQQFSGSYSQLLAAQGRSCPSRGDWERARRDTEDFLAFVQENLEALSLELPVSGVLPASQCVYDRERSPLPLFYGRCLLLSGKQELGCPDWRDEDERKFYLRKWSGRLRELADHMAGPELAERVYLEGEGSDTAPTAGLLRAEAYLCSAECYVQLANLAPQADREDREQCCFAPGRRALEGAALALEGVRHPWGEEDEGYRALRARWEAVRGLLPGTALPEAPPCAPALRLNTAEAAPPEAELIYSTAFDSAAGQSPEVVEAQLLQLAASPNVKLVLQLPQLLDNPNMTGFLLHRPGFKSLCQEGIVVLSSYTPANGSPILDPKDYILDRLQDPSFHFSASPELNDLEVRRRVRLGLMGHAPFRALSLPAQLEPIYEAYVLSSELFYPSCIKRYHQDPRCRGGQAEHRAPWRSQTLPQMIDGRISLLKRDDELRPTQGRRERLERLEALQRAAAGQQTRSAYYALIRRWREEQAYAGEDLDLFKRLVDICYGFSSGYRSTDRVLDLSSDGILRVHAQAECALVDPTGVMAYTVALTRRRASGGEGTGVLDLENVLRIARIAQRVAAEAGAERERLLEALRTETGLGYSRQPSGGALVTDCRIKSAWDGETSHISPRTAEEDGGALNMEFNTAEGGRKP